MNASIRFFLAAILMLASFGCGQAPDDGPRKSGTPAGGGGDKPAKELDRTIRINVATEPETIDSSLSKGIPEHKILLCLSEPLVRLNAKAEPTPGIAEKWEVNETNTVWTFHLRKNAKWHNGDPVTAKDFEYAVRRILDPKVGGQYADFVFNVLKGGREFYALETRTDATPFEGVKVLDDHTIEYHMQNPTPYFLTVVAHTSFLPLNRKVVEAGGKTWANDVKTFVGCGAFKLAEWRPHDRMILKKADTYWGKDEVWFDEVVIRMIDNENTELAAFESGEVDITDKVPFSEAAELRKTPHWYQGPYLGTYYVCFNTIAPPFDNKKLRQAFSKAIDRKLIVENVTKRGEPTATGLVPVGITLPDGRDYRDVAGDMIGPFDAAAAKKLLQESGVDPSTQFAYVYNTSDEHKIIGEQLQTLWREALGVTVKMENVEWKEKLRRGQTQEFQAMRNAWIGDYLDPLTFLEIFASDSLNNDGKYTNPKFDELLQKARAEGDWQKRRDMLVEAERMLIEDAAIAPIFFYTNPRLIRANIEGEVLNALGNMDITRARRVAGK